MPRYDRRITAINDLDLYKDTFKKRGVRRIEQYITQTLKNIDVEAFDYAERIWRDGDSFWKLSTKFYGDPQYWYIIARFNNTPTEAHVSIGDTVKIPINLSMALQVVS